MIESLREKHQKQAQVALAMEILNSNGYYVYDRPMNGESICPYPQFSPECREFHKVKQPPTNRE